VVERGKSGEESFGGPNGGPASCNDGKGRERWRSLKPCNEAT